MKALLTAAGLGKRLRPITETTPKPMLLIDGQPLLKYHLDHLQHYGITDVLINTHYLPEQIEQFVQDYLDNPANTIKVSTVFEPELLGSAGTLKINQDFFADEEDFLVVYGDNLTDIDYGKLIGQHKESDSVVTIASYYEHFPEQKGIIEYDDNLLISKFIEKPQPHEVTTNSANAGIYALNKKVFAILAKLEQTPLDFGHHVFTTLLTHGEPLRVYAMDETLLDIGNHENYTKAQSLPKIMNFKK